MPRAALVADDIAAFRRRAVVAATRLFAEHGYAAVTMRGLGAALGVSAMTSYRYLAGKEELFVLVRAEAFRRFADVLEAALAAAGDDPIARLGSLSDAYVGFGLEQPDAYRIMFELRGLAPAAGPAVTELAAQSRRAFGCLQRSVAAAVAGGHLEGDPKTLAHLFWAGTHGLVSLHLAGQLGQGRSIRQLARAQFATATRTAGRPPAAPRQRSPATHKRSR